MATPDLPLPFCVAGLLLGWRFLPGPRGDGPPTRFDWAGFALLGATLGSLLSVPVVGHLAAWTLPVEAPDLSS